MVRGGAFLHEHTHAHRGRPYPAEAMLIEAADGPTGFPPCPATGLGE